MAQLDERQSLDLMDLMVWVLILDTCTTDFILGKDDLPPFPHSNQVYMWEIFVLVKFSVTD